MNILIFNCGSSSQGFKVYQASGHDQPVVLVSGKAKNVATRTQAEAFIEWKSQSGNGSQKTDLSSHRLAASKIIALLKEQQVKVDAIGHRFVHGGTFFEKTAAIDPANMEKLKQCLPFAPIHNPNSFSVIEVCLEQYPAVPQFAVFDTAFHARMPQVSKQYALPQDLVEKYGYYKYGFHGLSYQYVSAQMPKLMGRPLEALKLILCHLGTGGSSVVAMKDGLPLDTSMGYSPLAGLVMSTRSGDLDPEIVLEMVRNGSSPEQVSQTLNNRSGLIGLSGFSSSLPEIITESEKGNTACQLAYDVYAHRLQTYLGAYTWLLDGADAIVFTDDVGLKSWKLRARVCGGVQNLGVEIDAEKNANAALDRASRVSSSRSKTQIWVVPTDEESVMLTEILAQFCPA